MSKWMIGVDLGGTNVRAGLVDDQFRIQKRAKAEIGSDTRFEIVMAKMAAVIREVVPDEGGLDAVEAIGVGSPGPLNRNTGVILETRNLNWDDVPLASTLSALLDGKPVWLENDAHAHGWGEFLVGAGRDVDDMLMLTLGTGVGGAIICDGRMILGKDGAAGHLGHIPIDYKNSMTQTFSGTVEALCSANAVARHAQTLLIHTETPSLLRSIPLESITAKAVADAAAQQDELAHRAWEIMGRALGVTCAGLANAFNPEQIVIGGGAIGAWEYFYPYIQIEMKKRTWPTMLRRVSVVQAQLGDDAGIIGAAGLASTRRKEN